MLCDLEKKTCMHHGEATISLSDKGNKSFQSVLVIGRLSLFNHFCFQAAALKNLWYTELPHFHISFCTYFKYYKVQPLFIACIQLENWHKSISEGLESVFKTRPSSTHQKGKTTLTIKF